MSSKFEVNGDLVKLILFPIQNTKFSFVLIVSHSTQCQPRLYPHAIKRSIYRKKSTSGFKFTSCALTATWAREEEETARRKSLVGSREAERKAKRSIMKGKSVLQEQSGQLNVAFDWAPSTSRKDTSFPQIGYSTFREAKNHKSNGTNTAAHHESHSDSSWKRWKPIKIEADLDLRVAVRLTMWTCDSACVCAHHARCCAISIDLEATTNIHSDKRPWVDSEKKTMYSHVPFGGACWMRRLLSRKMRLENVSGFGWARVSDFVRKGFPLTWSCELKWLRNECDGQIFAKKKNHIKVWREKKPQNSFVSFALGKDFSNNKTETNKDWKNSHWHKSWFLV